MSRVWTLHHYNPGKLKVSDGIPTPLTPPTLAHAPRHRIVPSNCTLVLAKPSSRHTRPLIHPPPPPRGLICFSLFFPPQLRFELCNLDCRCLPYPSNSYDVVHARNMHSGVGRVPLLPPLPQRALLSRHPQPSRIQIHDYPHFLSELTRILRPGGVLILIEFDLHPIADGKFTSSPAKSGIPGWCAVAEEVKRALAMRGVDTTVPARMGELVHDLGWYDQVYKQHADIPVGFWPNGARFFLGSYTPFERHVVLALDPTLLTVGQLAWMESDLLILAIRPLLLASGLDEKDVKMLTEAAQRDLYYPLVHIENRLHVVHAIKSA